MSVAHTSSGILWKIPTELQCTESVQPDTTSNIFLSAYKNMVQVLPNQEVKLPPAQSQCWPLRHHKPKTLFSFSTNINTGQTVTEYLKGQLQVTIFIKPKQASQCAQQAIFSCSFIHTGSPQQAAPHVCFGRFFTPDAPTQTVPKGTATTEYSNLAEHVRG